MKAILKGCRVNEFAQAINEWSREVAVSSEWRDLQSQGLCMDMWDRVNAEVQKIALACFSEEKHVSTPHLYAKTEVQELLKKQGR